MAYAKNRKATMSADEKRGVKELLSRVEQWLDERSLNEEGGQPSP
jgi:hypothetical protein